MKNLLNPHIYYLARYKDTNNKPRIKILCSSVPRYIGHVTKWSEGVYSYKTIPL